MKITKLIKYSLILLSLSGFSAFTFASGSNSYRPAQSEDRASYSLGKRVYSKKIACDSCPMAGKKLNKDLAKSMLDNGVRAELTNREKSALAGYLRKRFNL